MKKLLLVIIIIIVVLAGAYLGAGAVVNVKLQNEIRAMKAAGYATTISEIAPRATPEGLAAARLITAAYDTALACAGSRQESREKADLQRADSTDYSDDPALFQQIMDRYSSTFPLLLKAAEYPEVTFPFHYEQGWAMPLDSIPLAVQTGGRLLRIYAKVCFAQGRTEEAVKALRAAIHLAAGIKDNFALMTLVRGQQLLASGDLVRKLAPRLPATTLAALQFDCAAAESPGIYKSMLQAEMGLSQQAMVATGTWPQSEMPTAGLLLNIALGAPTLRKYARLVNMVVTRRQIELGARPWYQAKPDWDQDSIRHETQKLGGRLGMLAVINAHLLYTRLERGRAENEITRLGLAVLRYRAEHGRLPDKLEAAGGEKLIDPFSGQPYHYRSGVNGFLLYSVGSDMKDDGGTRPQDLSWQAQL